MKKNRKYLFLIALTAFSVSACNIEPDPVAIDEDPYGTGILYEEEIAGLSSVPKDLSIVTLEDASEINNSSRVLLTDYVPPVRSQGIYGTCSAWGAGYNTRTIMYAREHNLSPADLQNDANVFSPKDLFLAVRNEYGGNECNGANPLNTFSVMQNRGVATLAVSPYTDLGFCTQGTTSEANSDAAKYKIESFRYVDPSNIEALKSYLAMGRPVQISCELGLNFQQFSSSDVMYSDDYSGTPESHGRHSMCLIGYDDDKGTGGAFRIVNSWGTDWGDKGFAWIDYNFFVSKLCYSAYVIEGDKGGLAENMVDNEVINPNFQVDGKDFITVRFKDDIVSDKKRRLTYNVFNKGSETINASEDWNIVYYYYNAYNPENDYGIVIYDYYTDDVGAQYYGQNGDFSSVSTSMRKYGLSNWWNYVDVKPGYSVAKAVAGDTGYDYDFTFDYEMPSISGDYYLVLMADGFNTLEEQYEQNNFIFFTGEDKTPLKIVNGVIQGVTAKHSEENVVNSGELKKSKPNAYRIDEISKLIKYQQRTGKLHERAEQFQKSTNFKGEKHLIEAVLPRTM